MIKKITEFGLGAGAGVSSVESSVVIVGGAGGLLIVVGGAGLSA